MRAVSKAYRRALAALTLLTTLLVASTAAACPVCASREEPGNLRWVALGAFIVAPWLIAGAVALYIRKGLLSEREPLTGGLDQAQLPTENIE